jgi:hypothetical protein
VERAKPRGASKAIKSIIRLLRNGAAIDQNILFFLGGSRLATLDGLLLLLIGL